VCLCVRFLFCKNGFLNIVVFLKIYILHMIIEDKNYYDADDDDV